MFPCFAGQYSVNCVVSNAILFSYFGLSMRAIGKKLTNLMDLFSGQFCRMNFFAVRRSASSLVYHILRVIGFCSGKQMIGVNAAANIAFMQRKHAIGQWSVMQFITEAVSNHFLAPNTKLPIAVGKCGTCPQPAFIRFAFSDFCPKTIFSRVAFVLMAFDVLKMLTFCYAALGVVLCSDLGFLSTTAHAQTARIGRLYKWAIMTGMASNVSSIFALFAAKSGMVLVNYVGLLAASALAISVRDFLGGLIRGMLAHVSSSFRLLTMPQAAYDSAAALLLAYYRCNYSINMPGTEVL